ncbi:MAG: 16S rRNA (cytidine(1402)-2'-O)-methyltransferase [Coriobacteriia bacterium]|nr:16S rRNA (cytidine(1402)-2'-O)-methyltransferase [Coriobacteriia bacterium]
MQNKTQLFMVATPIGNLEDASPRALRIFDEVDTILAEDTRVTRKLLNHFDIKTPLERCDEHVISSKSDALVERMSSGERFAFVSDAGMPGISDPGTVLVDKALDQGIKVEVIPGPSAVITALAASGLGIDNFYFAGFLPRKASQRQQALQALSFYAGALVFYESPLRLLATLEALAQAFPNRKALVARELTKLHEELYRDDLPKLFDEFSKRESIKGEIVIVVDALRDHSGRALSPQEAYEDFISRLNSQILPEDPLEFASQLPEDLKTSEKAKQLAQAYNISRKEAYDLLVGK